LNKNYSDSIDKTQIINQIKIKFSNNYFDNYSYKATTIYPLPGILKQVDRNSMAFSVESRLPFLDYRLVEFVFSLPMEYKINGANSKMIYRDALKNLLPKEIVNRNTKLGFVTPEPLWIKNNLSQIFKEVYNMESCSLFFDTELLINKFNRFLAGEENFSTIYWQVFNFLIWYNIFFENKDIDHV
jgi:asparagine synthase (glutamine-hydrolysing)